MQEENTAARSVQVSSITNHVAYPMTTRHPNKVLAEEDTKRKPLDLLAYPLHTAYCWF